MVEPKVVRCLFNALVVFSLLLPGAAAARSETIAPKLQRYLANLVESNSSETIAVIVQKQNEGMEVEEMIRAAGGQVTRALPIINGFAAKTPVSALKLLANSEAVRWVSLDAPVENQANLKSDSTYINDEFDSVSYTGNSGNGVWQSAWEEIGEADGAVQGEIAVVSFWGGALQGLRLQGSNKGAWRRVDLSQATNAHVQLSFRRKDFRSENDYVSLELSSDGGTNWSEVTRWSGPATDSEIHNEVYDIQAYASSQSTLRFITSAKMQQDARFYLDGIRIDFTTASPSTELGASHVYLPMVASGDSKTGATNSTTPVLNKEAELAQLVQASGVCTYHCIDLGRLASSYVKAINADKLWNVDPKYVRGYDVTVAVVDSGISPHPDLNDYNGVSRVIKRVNFTPSYTSPDDFYGHGTHIAGTIAGLGQSSGGVYLGVAMEAKLVDVKVMDDWGYGNTSDVVAGLQWIYNNRTTYNIKVVNLSLNSRVPESYQESALNAALETLWFNKVVVVVSAGNGGGQRLYAPANDPFVITVGAIDDKGTASSTDDTMPSFSAYGMTGDGILKPDLVAPGTSIVAPLSGSDNNLIWAHPENMLAGSYTQYYRMSGTSMASAVVAGAVAVLLEDEPTLTPDQVKYRLKATARPLSTGASCAAGAGSLNIEAAVYGTTTQNANTGVQASKLLWSGSTPINWSSVNWNSVNWNSVNWNSVNWNSVNWNSSSWSDTSGNGSCTSAIKKLVLVNADTDQDIQTLYDGAVININAAGTRNLSVRAETVGSVESVRFSLNSDSYTRIENTLPYALASQTNGNYAPYTFNNGIYKLRATAYPYDNAIGTQGADMEIGFAVAGSSRCELEGTVHSQSGQPPMRVNVYNNSTTQLEMFWLDYAGARESYGVIPPGLSWAVTTFGDHPWIVARDSDDRCVHLIPQSGPEANVIVTNDDITANTNVNLALSKTTAASSSYDSTLAPLAAVDGDVNTRWQSLNGSFPQWLQVNLGSSRTLNTVIVRFNEFDNSTFKYRIEGSTCCGTWTTLVDRTLNGVTDSDGTIAEAVAGSYRFVRIYVTNINNSHWTSIREFEVYGN